MPAKWKYLGDFSDGYDTPTVLLDQNISIRRLAVYLFEKNFRVVRAVASATIPDDDVRAEADRLNAMVITMDKGFEPHPRSLVILPRKGIKRSGYVGVAETVEYIFGRRTDPPENYRNGHKNGNERMNAQFEKEARYWDRVDGLRTLFAGNLR